jgi:tetratricopeptide (TPR) repeat protein
MAIDKSRTSPFVKGVIIFVAITFVLGIAGTAFVPLLEAIFNPTATTGAGGSGSANASDTVAAISAKYVTTTQNNDNALKADPKNYNLLVSQAQSYHDWANDIMQATQQQGGTDRPLWLLAVDFYRKALEVKAGDPNVTTDMAIAQFYSGDIEGAIATGLALEKADAKFAAVRFNMGVFYSAAGDNAKAIAQYEEYIKLEPKGDLVTEANTRITDLKANPGSTTASGTP